MHTPNWQSHAIKYLMNIISIALQKEDIVRDKLLKTSLSTSLLEESGLIQSKEAFEKHNRQIMTRTLYVNGAIMAPLLLYSLGPSFT